MALAVAVVRFLAMAGGGIAFIALALSVVRILSPVGGGIALTASGVVVGCARCLAPRRAMSLRHFSSFRTARRSSFFRFAEGSASHLSSSLSSMRKSSSAS